MSKPLHILAFDLDNTLLDPGSTLYARLHRDFLSSLTAGVPVEAMMEEFERVRRCGDALERLGLANPIHDRGHPQALAAFALTAPWDVLYGNPASTNSTERQAFRRTLERLRSLHEATTVGTYEERLDAELRLRQMLRSSAAPGELRDAITSLAEEPGLREHARRYAALEESQPHRDHLPFLGEMADRGITIAVVSHGRVDVQAVKLRRLNLAPLFDGRLLVTESATRVAGRDELDRQIERVMECQATGDVPQGELVLLWRYRCILDRWSRKSPEFYARCLHALAQTPTDPQRDLADLRELPFDAWSRNDIRFVMVGDRFDTDIAPVLACLGRDQSETVHLRCGKYAQAAFPASAEDGAHRTFACWHDVEQHLLNVLDWGRVGPIRTTPALFRPADFDDDVLSFGRRNSLPIVRAVSELAARVLR